VVTSGHVTTMAVTLFNTARRPNTKTFLHIQYLPYDNPEIDYILRHGYLTLIFAVSAILPNSTLMKVNPADLGLQR